MLKHAFCTRQQPKPPAEENISNAQLEYVNSANLLGAEIYREGQDHILHGLFDVLSAMWTEKKIPEDLKDGIVIPIYKKKVNRQECSNHRGISLLALAGKILGKSSLNR